MHCLVCLSVMHSIIFAEVWTQTKKLCVRVLFKLSYGMHLTLVTC